MKTDKQIDELFRKGLPSVDVPAPPVQDWAAMARTARSGAVGAKRSDAMNSRWAKLLGGAMAVAVGVYLAIGGNGTLTSNRSQLTPADPLAMLNESASTAPVTQETSGPVGTNTKAFRPTSSNASSEPDAQHAEDAQAMSSSSGEAHSPESTRGSRSRGSNDDGPALLYARKAATASGQGPEKAAPAILNEPTVYVAHAEDTEMLPYQSITSEGDLRTSLAMMVPLGSASAPLPYQPEASHHAELEEGHLTPHWSIAPWISIGHSTYKDPDHDGASATQGLIYGRETPGSVGLRVQYAFDRRLAFFTGIQFSRKGALGGTVSSSSTVRTDYQLSGNYVEVPLNLKFIVPLENKDLYARAGVSLQFNMPSSTNKVTMHDENKKELSTLVLAGSSMGTVLDLGIGAQFRLSRRVGLFIEPSYQYALSPAVKHPSFDRLPFNPRIHTFSLATGLSFQFR